MKQKLWINNNAEDRTYMLEKTEESHPGVGQAAIEKDWWVSPLVYPLDDCLVAVNETLNHLHVSDVGTMEEVDDVANEEGYHAHQHVT